MSEMLKELVRNREYRNIKEQWFKIDPDSWMPFNFDDFLDTDVYMRELKKEFEKLKKEKGID